jgi:two-component system chemotaxis response regulator CheY
MRILIVEDDPGSLRLLMLSLMHAGHEIVQATDGQVAWDIWQKENIRLVVTDWMMPEMSGTELIQKIRTAGRGYTYIIMVTAVGDKPKVVAGLSSGADDYITKPYDPDELAARVGIGVRIIQLEENLSASRSQMEFLAMHDTLTGLFNRRAIQERAEADLSRALREQTPLSVALLDIDHFKAVNDTHGHDVGDQALRLVAEVLTANIRGYDAVGRWGGEEFLVVLPGDSLIDAAIVAERIRVSVTEITLELAGGKRLPLTASLGIASWPGTASQPLTLDQLIHQADEALYRAKSEGRNRVCLAEPHA